MNTKLHARRRLRTGFRGGQTRLPTLSLEWSTRMRQATSAGNCLRLEWLEPRCLLSGGLPPSIASVQPYDGEQLTQSPQQLAITFNGVNVPALMGNFDVQIEKLNPDGTETPLWTLFDAPPEESTSAGNELIIPMQKFDLSDFSYDNITLPAGQYQIDLLGGTGISQGASGALAGGSDFWNPNDNYAIGTFTILGQGATLGSATALGTISSSERTVWGSIEPNDPNSAVGFYQFTLPAGQVWQVGLAISAQSIDSPFLADLAASIRAGRCWRIAALDKGFQATRTIPISSPDCQVALTTWGFPAPGTCPTARGDITRYWDLPD